MAKGRISRVAEVELTMDGAVERAGLRRPPGCMLLSQALVIFEGGTVTEDTGITPARTEEEKRSDAV